MGHKTYHTTETEQAIEVMLKHGHSIMLIAYRLGFGNSNSLNVFMHRTGLRSRDYPTIPFGQHNFPQERLVEIKAVILMLLSKIEIKPIKNIDAAAQYCYNEIMQSGNMEWTYVDVANGLKNWMESLVD